MHELTAGMTGILNGHDRAAGNSEGHGSFGDYSENLL